MDISDVRKAYRKLKSSVYFDKTQLPLRDKIVHYEGLDDGMHGGIDSKLEVLFEALSDDSKWKVLTKEIIDSINVLAYPKSMTKKGGEGCRIVSNANVCPSIKDIYKFIEMDVEGHILGVLWITQIGYILDEGVYAHSYGNRIRSTLKCSTTGTVSSSPYLFEPYFVKYENWRDEGLKIAQNLMNENSDVALLCLDIKDFYGSVDIPRDEFNKILHCVNSSSDIASRLHSFVYEVMSAYSKKLKLPNGQCSLPIGFLPSNILSNWCLQPFDKAIVDGLNPAYYGRYVDDILIVEKIERNSTLGNAALKDKLKDSMIIQHCLIDGNKWVGLNSGKNPPLLREPQEGDDCYRIRREYLNSNTELLLAKEKIKLFYFCENQSDALLKCFQEEISKNRSEFRFLPKEEFVLGDGDFYKAYSLERNDTINKLRGVADIEINKYELSKYLGKSLAISNLLLDAEDNVFFSNLEKVFNSRTIIDTYSLWERVFELLISNRHYTRTAQFMARILDAINKIELADNSSSLGKSEIEKSLKKVLRASISRPLSLVSDSGIDRVFVELRSELIALKLDEDVEEYKQEILRNKGLYLKSQMYNRNLTPIEVGGLISLDSNLDLNEVQLFQFEEVLGCAYTHLLNFNDSMTSLFDIEYKYRPTYLSAGDISHMNELWNLINSSIDVEFSKCWADRENNSIEQREIYRKINFPNYLDKQTELVDDSSWIKCEEISTSGSDNSDGSRWTIDAGSKAFNKVKIALANTSLHCSASGNPDEVFEGVLKKKIVRTRKRLSSVNRLVNGAIDGRADILALPEAFLPLDWLLPIAKRCAQNDMALIAGIEHVLLGNTVFNLTAVALPVRVHNVTTPIIFLRPKKHYAPEEKKMIEGYGFRLFRGLDSPLYCWNGFNFPVYCCYELASIEDRGIWKSYADAIFAVEWNRDINYFSNIVESWSRDLHCYIIQANISHYGDSRIVAPKETVLRDIVRVKGGKNAVVLIDEIDIGALRDFQQKSHDLQKDDKAFKQTPPGFRRKPMP